MCCRVNNIVFLLSSFNDIIQSFGMNSNSVEFYRKQLDNMVSMQQITTYDIDIVEEVIGMKNTNAVKWESAIKKINNFTSAVNILSGADSKDTLKDWIKQLRLNNSITSNLERTLYKVYGV